MLIIVFKSHLICDSFYFELVFDLRGMSNVGVNQMGKLRLELKIEVGLCNSTSAYDSRKLMAIKLLINSIRYANSSIY